MGLSQDFEHQRLRMGGEIEISQVLRDSSSRGRSKRIKLMSACSLRNLKLYRFLGAWGLHVSVDEI